MLVRMGVRVVLLVPVVNLSRVVAILAVLKPRRKSERNKEEKKKKKLKPPPHAPQILERHQVDNTKAGDKGPVRAARNVPDLRREPKK